MAGKIGGVIAIAALVGRALLIDTERMLIRAEVARLLSWWILGEGADCVQSAEPTS
jgi:hypothetical protein